MSLTITDITDLIPEFIYYVRFAAYIKKLSGYVLTGANRGGKTTVTQAAGLLFSLAQGGIFVPADSFIFHPVDCIYTHFPADEDKTLDLGRLGEECQRFRELYADSTENSLLLLNETFSLIVKADGGNRSFKIEIAPPEGMSYAGDIAEKYGVTYEMLVGHKEVKG